MRVTNSWFSNDLCWMPGAEVWQPSPEYWAHEEHISSPTLSSLGAEFDHFGNAYPDGWDGEGSLGPTERAICIMRRVLGCIPSGLVLPKSMLSPSGEIALYWDLGNGAYADLGVDVAGSISFFSRDVLEKELFEDDIDLAAIDADWFWSRIGRLAAAKRADAA